MALPHNSGMECPRVRHRFFTNDCACNSLRVYSHASGSVRLYLATGVL